MNVAMAGTDPPNIGIHDLNNIKIPLPSVPEQRKIATVLSTIDKEISIHQNQLSTLKQQKKGLMQQLLTGKRWVTP